MINALTFDIEDWFQVRNLSSKIDFSQWHYQESRIEKSVYKLLGVLRRNNVKATFFTLGWVAEKYPDLIENISFEGHEIASHGYRHRLVYEMTPEEFEQDLVKSIDVLREVTNKRVIGFRAPSFSITKKSSWAFEVLERNGIKYDCSVFPIIHPEYGIPDAPRGIHNTNYGVVEFPSSTLRVAGFNLPVGGGGYFRTMPYSLTRIAMRQINKKMPAMVYIHPWELDPKQPKIKAGPIKGFRHYTNLDTTLPKLKRLLQDFKFDSVKNILFGEEE